MRRKKDANALKVSNKLPQPVLFKNKTPVINNPPMRQIRFTKKGYEKLKKEYNELRKIRPSAVLDLKKAREMGDLSENGYYKASRTRLFEIDRNLRKFMLDLKSAVIVETSSKNIVGIGNVIILSDGKKEIKYEVVGDMEADPINGKISLLSPIGQAIENKKSGDKIEIQAPAGRSRYQILSIS